MADTDPIPKTLLAFDVPNDIRIWRQAVYSALEEDGNNLVYIHVRHDETGEYPYRYSWGISYKVEDKLTRAERMKCWKQFHQALVVCEALRPVTLRPSQALRDRLERNGNF